MSEPKLVNLADVAEALIVANDALLRVIDLCSVKTDDGRTVTVLGIMATDARELVRTLEFVVESAIRAMPKITWPLAEVDEPS